MTDPIASTPRPKRGIQKNRVVRIKSANGLFHLLQVRPVRWLGWVTVFAGDRCDCGFKVRRIFWALSWGGSLSDEELKDIVRLSLWNRAAQASYRYAAVKALRDWAQGKQRRA